MITTKKDSQLISSLLGFDQPTIDNTVPEEEVIADFDRRYAEGRPNFSWCIKDISKHSGILTVKAYIDGLLDASDLETGFNAQDLATDNLSLSEAQRQRLNRYLFRAKRAISKGRKPPMLVVSGPDGYGKMTLIDAVCRELGVRLKDLTDDVEAAEYTDAKAKKESRLGDESVKLGGVIFDTSSQYDRETSGLHIISEQAFSYFRRLQTPEVVVLNSRDYTINTPFGARILTEEYSYVGEAFFHIRLDENCYKDRDQVGLLIAALTKKFNFSGEVSDDFVARFCQTTLKLSPANLNAVFLQGAKMAALEGEEFTKEGLLVALGVFVEDHPVKETEVTVTFPKTKLTDVILPAKLKDQLRKILAKAENLTSKRLDSIKKAHSYINFDVVGVLLEGDPGLGKTMAAKAVAGSLGKALFSIDLGKVLGAYVGESEKALSEAFHKAEASGAVLLLDECDALLADRSSQDSQHQKRLVNHLLQLIEGYKGILFMTTNFGSSLDKALFRRCTHRVVFTMPGESEKAEILSIHLSGFPLAQGFNAEAAVKGLKATGGLIKNAVVRIYDLLFEGTITEVSTETMRRELDQVVKENSAGGIGKRKVFSDESGEPMAPIGFGARKEENNQ